MLTNTSIKDGTVKVHKHDQNITNLDDEGLWPLNSADDCTGKYTEYIGF